MSFVRDRRQLGSISKCIAGSANNTGSAPNVQQATPLAAFTFLILTDFENAYSDWGTSKQTLITRAAPADLRKQEFVSESMRPKVEAAADFVENGRQVAGARAILEGTAGTLVTP